MTTGLAEQGGPGVKLTADTLAGLEETSRSSAGVESQALADWEADVRHSA